MGLGVLDGWDGSPGGVPYRAPSLLITVKSQKKRLPFKLGVVELGDGETVVEIGIHCRLLLTKVGL